MRQSASHLVDRKELQGPWKRRALGRRAQDGEVIPAKKWANYDFPSGMQGVHQADVLTGAGQGTPDGLI